MLCSPSTPPASGCHNSAVENHSVKTFFTLLGLRNRLQFFCWRHLGFGLGLMQWVQLNSQQRPRHKLPTFRLDQIILTHHLHTACFCVRDHLHTVKTRNKLWRHCYQQCQFCLFNWAMKMEKCLNFKTPVNLGERKYSNLVVIVIVA